MASGAAKRYAQAILSLAKEQDTLDAWRADLARLNDLLSDPVAAAFFVDPGVTEAQKRDMLDRLLADSQPAARNLARLLIDRNRLEIIPRLFAIYEAGLRAERGIAIAEVTTAEPLGPSEQALVRERLTRLTGQQIDLRLRVDADIIGGIIARVGDLLIDGSVVTRLRQLRARLVTTGR